ncbi:hypothetical protein HanRHA438_Chr08g0340941 [Helianthus annuus]|nr:hypothetical protein HanHA89_Chr08g0289471 [Helianthus annuus]KAJ0721757.1 hypothetical protein HanOQP8_Chr08g0279011 [Helianthus annuus]KAJ0897011.1 hypothetical protein HanRHA438_Chr08g0340941 [Helianthus annuus]KAJ0900876.1 hypothetical protein HanPSC8_Chr08g0318751 [Helianthus annuus]
MSLHHNRIISSYFISVVDLISDLAPPCISPLWFPFQTGYGNVESVVMYCSGYGNVNLLCCIAPVREMMNLF